jgi:hypothetical protein
MKTPSVLFVTILFLSTGGGCKQENNVMGTNSVLETKLESQKLKLGQDINFTVQLKNTSSQNLWVNQRMLLNSSHSPVMMREIWVDVVGPDGEQIPFSSRVRAGEAVASDFNVLKPGQVVSKQNNLANYFEFKKPGVYQITAHYQDGTKELPKAPDGALHLGEQLNSASAKFELLAPK